MIVLSLHHSKLAAFAADCVFAAVFEEKEIFAEQIAGLEKQLHGSGRALSSSGFAGKEGESLDLFPENTAARRVTLLGAGKASACTREKLRSIAARAVKIARKAKLAHIAVATIDDRLLTKTAIDLEHTPAEQCVECFSEGALLAAYAYDKYFSDPEKKIRHLEKVTIIAGEIVSSIRKKMLTEAVKRTQIVCEAVYLARDLENAPGSEIYPATLARAAAAAGRKSGFRVKIHDKKSIERLKMGGLLGVASGSHKPPCFIEMTYAPRRFSGTVVLVGKGVTFDSGGISIKPAAAMWEMKMDMSGAAAVIATMQAVSGLKLGMRVIGLVPAAENLPGGSALKPGDIITHLNGKTSEVDNTDAEGRLILADALSYAQRLKPDLVIDLATLTGAVVVALGHHATGMLGTDEAAMVRLKESGTRTNERVWQLPLFEEYAKQIKSQVADVKNVGGRWGGASTAAMFLKQFIGTYKWVHLDIAGTAYLEEATDYIPLGGTGVGVRLLVDFLRRWRPL